MVSYRVYKVMKKPGHYETLDNGHRVYVPAKYRTITAPDETLKREQRRILDEVLSKVKISDRAFGFTQDRDIKSNAHEHIDSQWILEMDLKDFFDTITREHVMTALIRNGIDKCEAEYISDVCTWKGTTPQGAPTSPTLSNIVCKPMDKKLRRLAKENGCIYSRYADDIAISSKDKDNGYAILKGMEGSIESIIQKAGFKLNKQKTQIVGSHRKQSVTGVTVNTKRDVYPSSKLRREVDSLTYRALRDARAGKIQTYHDLERELESYHRMRGKANYLCQINKGQNEKYMKRLEELVEILKR